MVFAPSLQEEGSRLVLDSIVGVQTIKHHPLNSLEGRNKHAVMDSFD